MIDHEISRWLTKDHKMHLNQDANDVPVFWNTNTMFPWLKVTAQCCLSITSTFFQSKQASWNAGCVAVLSQNAGLDLVTNMLKPWMCCNPETGLTHINLIENRRCADSYYALCNSDVDVGSTWRWSQTDPRHVTSMVFFTLRHVYPNIATSTWVNFSTWQDLVEL